MHHQVPCLALSALHLAVPQHVFGSCAWPQALFPTLHCSSPWHSCPRQAALVVQSQHLWRRPGGHLPLLSVSQWHS